MLLSLSEIINKACKMQTKEEKVEWLRKNDTAPLRTILKNTYDKSVEFLIPSVAPPWKKMVTSTLKECYLKKPGGYAFL